MVYPRRNPHANPKKPARQKYEAAIKKGVNPADIFKGAKHYAAYVVQNQTDPQFITQAITWLNQERWTEYQVEPKPAKSSQNPQAKDLHYG